MSTTTDKLIRLYGSPFAWVHLINAGALSELWKFDNLQNPSYKFTKPGTDTGGENIDIQRADGAIIRFPKKSLILSGIDETDITPADASSDATSKGEITLVINEAPSSSASYTAFLKSIKDNYDKMFLITLGTGYSYQQSISATRKPDGWAYMIGKINNDIEQTLDSNPGTTTLTFVSYTNSGLDASDLTADDLFTTQKLKLGGTGKDVDGIKPKTISADDATKLLAGDIVIVSETA